jgi:alpha-D-ribose 1-methylphosphonate 5-triphosphate synthase subunit PhnH
MYDSAVLETSHSTALWFRNIMQSMSRPGLIVPIHGSIVDVPAGFADIPAILAVTLADFQTPVWLAPDLNTQAVAKFIRFETGAALCAEPGLATFVFVNTSDAAGVLDQLSTGTHEYPDRAATLIILTNGFDVGQKVEFSGPGIKNCVTVQVADTGQDFWTSLQSINSGYPTGIDVIFAGRDAVLSSPRSTKISLRDGD